MKRKHGVLFYLLITVAVIGVACFGYLKYRTDYALEEITSSKSPDQKHELVIYQVGTPGFPFGSGTCRLVLKQGKKKLASEDVEMANDGKWPDEENFAVEWLDDEVRVTVMGEEMDDVTVTMKY